MRLQHLWSSEEHGNTNLPEQRPLDRFQNVSDGTKELSVNTPQHPCLEQTPVCARSYCYDAAPHPYHSHIHYMAVLT